MAGLFGGGTPATTTTKYAQIQVQTSARGLCIPVGWGTNRWTTNIIWYGNFKAANADKGGGKGGGGKSTTYTYTAAVILALGEGPTQFIGSVWADGQFSSLGSLNLDYFHGGSGQSIPAWFESNYQSEALPYAYTSYLFSNLYSLGDSATLPDHNFEVGSTFATLEQYDANMADVINDMVVNSQYGLDPGAAYIDPNSLALFRTYQAAQGLLFSPYLNRQEKGISILQRWLQLANTWGFWSGNAFKFVPLGDVPLSANNTTYTPNNSPVFDFDYADFVLDGENTLQIQVVDPWEGYNHVEVDINERNQSYMNNPIYWEDQTSVDQYGQLQSEIISAPEITKNSIGAIVAQLIGKRSVYIRRLPKFKENLGVGALLEPGDIITLTAPDLNLVKWPCRVTDVKEDENFQITIEAEEFPGAVGSATLYPPDDNNATGLPNFYADPGLVNTPMIFEPPIAITGGIPQLWIAASGGPNWGGAEVYVSPDNVNYVQIGDVELGTVQGTLTSNLPVGSDPDLTHMLAINTTESGGVLSTAVTQQMADSYQTASLVDNEILSYGTVSLTGTNTFALSYLRRGAYDTPIQNHNTGAQFYQINPSAILKYTYPQNYVGDTIYFKFTSFNQFGNSTDDISESVTYTYTIMGLAYSVDPPSSISLSTSDISSVLAMHVSWGSSPSTNVTGYDIQLSINGGVTWPFATTVGANTNDYYLNNPPTDTNFIARVQTQGINSSGQVVSTWITSTVVNSGASPSETPAQPTGFAASVTSSATASLTWTASGDSSITNQIILRSSTSTSLSSASTLTVLDNGTATSYNDTSVSIGGTYTYWLDYVNPYGASPVSASTTATITLPSGADIVTSNGKTLTSLGQVVIT